MALCYSITPVKVASLFNMMFVEYAWNAQQSPIKERLSTWEAYNIGLKLNCFELGEQLN